jgi:hypothetical protein
MSSGFHSIYHEAEKTALAELSGYQYKVLHYLCSVADERGVAYPEAKKIAESVECNVRHVWRCLARLIELGYMAYLRHGEYDSLKKRRTSNVYMVSPAFMRIAPHNQRESEALWAARLCDSIDTSEVQYGSENLQKAMCHGSHDKESSSRISIQESAQESISRINQESSSTAPTADALPLNTDEAQGETIHGGITAGAQVLRTEAANAAEIGEGQDKTPEQRESRKKPATLQPAGQKKPTPHSPPPADDETQEADARRYPQPNPITTPLEDTAEALATRLHEIGIPRPLGRAFIQEYGFFQTEQALVQVHAAARTTTVTSPSGLFRHFLQKPIIDPGVEKNVKPRGKRKKSKSETESDYTGGKYAGIIES